MGILITTGLEQFIGKLMEKQPNISAKEIANALESSDWLHDDLSSEELSKMTSLIRLKLEEPCHPQNTAKQDVWRKARGISHILTSEKHRRGGFAKSVGHIQTTSGIIS